MVNLLKNVFSQPRKPKNQVVPAIKLKDQRGVAILEFTIIAPFLVLCAIMIVDLSFLLVDCMIVSQVAKEGVRALSSFPGIVTAAAPVAYESVDRSNWTAHETSLLAACKVTPSTTACGLFRSQYRMNELLKIHGLVSSVINLTTEVQRLTGTGVTQPDSVMVTLRVKLDQGILLRGMSFDIRERGPYLFR
jgi:hypothetical protein